MNLHRAFIITVLFSLSGRLQADTAPLIATPGTGGFFTPYGYATLGNQFQVGANPLTITALGLFDGGTPGLDQGHFVGLWAMDGTLLSEVDFSPGLDGFTVNGFLYQNLATPVVLQLGVSYILGAQYPSVTTDGLYVNGTLHYETWSSSVSFQKGRYTASGSGSTFPNLQVGGISYVGPNALFAVPEPTTLSFLLCFATAYGFWRVGRKAALKY